MAASSIRKRSLTPQAARISPVGSLLAVKLALSRSSARGESPVAGPQQQPPVGPRRVGGPAAATELLPKDALADVVTISPASRSRWKWSAMIRACGSACSTADR